jgi:SPP1 gp7 family putative phage head morphogenesis protein
MISRLDSVFGKPQPDFSGDRPMISQRIITTALDAVELPLVNSQTRILEAATERLLERADPFLKARNLQRIIELSWNANLRLQQPIYSLWADGYALGGAHMQAEVRASIPKKDRSSVSEILRRSPVQGKASEDSGTLELFALSSDVAGLLAQFLELAPGQLVASAANAAVLNRAISLSGNFARSQIGDIQAHLIAAIVPQADTGDPIGRKELLKRIEKTLGVGRSRAENIARTELTTAYNVGRVEMGKRSTLVEAFRFIVISDNRTTEICRSREGLIIPADDMGLVNANTPALHFRCRSTLSPIMPSVNPMHRRLMAEPSRRAENRTLTPLMKGWGNATAARPAVERRAAETAEAARKKAAEAARKKAAEAARKKAAEAAEAARRIKSRPGSAAEFIALGRDRNAQYINQLRALEQPVQIAQALTTRHAEAKRLLMANPSDAATQRNFLQAERALRAPRRQQAAQKTQVFESWRQDLISRGDAAKAKGWAERDISIAASAREVRPEAVLRAELAEFHQLTQGKVENSLQSLTFQGDRAWANESGLINIGRHTSESDAKTVLFHEAGHHIEFGDRRFYTAADEWMQGRATSSTPRPIPGMPVTEVSLPGNFIDPYVSKIYTYQSGPQAGLRYESTEVLSMGLEHFASPSGMKVLYEKDREMFDLMLGVLESD